MEIEAAVFRRVREPLTIEAVEIDKPWGREVLVRTAATGVCHSDLHVVDGVGRFPLDRPIVLGHEGAGVVEAVGAEVTTVKPGDHVVACLSGFCGNCPQCLSGHPNLCTGGIVTRPDASPPRLSQQGQPLRQFIGISSYAEKMLLHENSLVKIDPDIAPRQSRACRLWRIDGCRRGIALVRARSGSDGGGVRLRRRRPRQSSRAPASAARGRSSASISSNRSAKWRPAPVRPISSTAPRRTR